MKRIPSCLALLTRYEYLQDVAESMAKLQERVEWIRSLLAEADGEVDPDNSEALLTSATVNAPDCDPGTQVRQEQDVDSDDKGETPSVEVSGAGTTSPAAHPSPRAARSMKYQITGAATLGIAFFMYIHIIRGPDQINTPSPTCCA